MDTTKRIELDCVVENREYVHKLGAALDTNNTAVKKQVFELLAALSAYNSDGHARTLETLEHYKVRSSGYVCWPNRRFTHHTCVAETEKRPLPLGGGHQRAGEIANHRLPGCAVVVHQLCHFVGRLFARSDPAAK